MSSQPDSTFFEIQSQFLCCVPIKQIQWKVNDLYYLLILNHTFVLYLNFELNSINSSSLQGTLSNLSWDEQHRLLSETVCLEKVQKYPLDRNYMVRFIRCIIDALEGQNLEVHDDFYTILCDFQSKSNDCDSEYSYKHYQVLIDRNIETVTLKENRNKISNGTTGLNVWESALAISEWAIENRCHFDNKHCLELGAGTGLSSLIIAKCCSPKTIHITDGNDRVIENLVENVADNFEKLNDNFQQYYYATNKCTIGSYKSFYNRKYHFKLIFDEFVGNFAFL